MLWWRLLQLRQMGQRRSRSIDCSTAPANKALETLRGRARKCRGLHVARIGSGTRTIAHAACRSIFPGFAWPWPPNAEDLEFKLECRELYPTSSNEKPK